VAFNASKHGVYPLLAAGGPGTFVATYGVAILSTYKNKQQRKTYPKRLSAEMLLCAHGLYSANRTEPGLQLFCPTLFAQSYTSAKTCYALQPHRSPLFCPLSSEAYLLTGKKNSFLVE
jgi:hypothetical protein